MKLSKPEDMDEIEEPAEEQNGGSDGDSGPPNTSVLLEEVLEQPAQFGFAVEGTVADLAERVEQQQEAIAELAHAVELLASNQGEMAHNDPEAPPSVRLDSGPLSGIYDPTEEF